jgi:uncharacterized protein (TIGR03067 family)
MLALSVAIAGPASKEKTEQGKIEGNWIVEKYVQGGKENEKRKGMHFKFADGKVMVQEEEASDIRYAADPKKTPATLDLISAAGTIPGIYKIEGETLTICFSKSDKEGRPTKFESPDESPIVVMTLKRESKK